MTSNWSKIETSVIVKRYGDQCSNNAVFLLWSNHCSLHVESLREAYADTWLHLVLGELHLAYNINFLKFRSHSIPLLPPSKLSMVRPHS